MPKRGNGRRSVAALEVRQWLKQWDSMEFDPAARRRRPPRSFFVFTMEARDLRALSGIQRRSEAAAGRRADDIGIQRAHDPARSAEISRFVRNGYPWSTLRESDRFSGQYEDLRKPGWLPTAIVVNVLTGEDERSDGKVGLADLVEIVQDDSGAHVRLPEGFDHSWRPTAVHPIEVIDGQHRLWAFEESLGDAYDLPVVAFVGLDISWQAYLFWTINIKPTKINPSLAFDLYPLLRSEDWLERLEGPAVYREARAQELTEVLWSHPDSPWYRRINMLGQTRGLGVTQAGWVRTLTATLLRRGSPRSRTPGGLFATPPRGHAEPLPWNRTQQAALLIAGWRSMRQAAVNTTADWARFLRSEVEADESDPVDAFEAPFAGRNTYLNTEQGVRAYLSVLNDLLYESADDLDLAAWEAVTASGGVDEEDVNAELVRFDDQPVAGYVDRLSTALAEWDWRGADAPGLKAEERLLKRAFRGSGGYVEFRRQLLRHLGRKADEDIRRSANDLYRLIKDRK